SKQLTAGFRIPPFSIYVSPVHSDQDFAKAGWVIAPVLKRCRRLREGHNFADRLAYGKLALLEHFNHIAEVFRSGIARTQDIQFLLYKQPCLIAYRFLRVTDVYHSSSKRYLLHGRSKGSR